MIARRSKSTSRVTDSSAVMWALMIILFAVIPSIGGRFFGFEAAFLALVLGLPVWSYFDRNTPERPSSS